MPKTEPKPPPTPGSLISNSKLRGEWAELRFMTRVAEHGVMISKPWGDSARYDLMIEHHGRVLRIQVKSTMRIVRGCYRCHLPTAAPPTNLSSRARQSPPSEPRVLTGEVERGPLSFPEQARIHCRNPSLRTRSTSWPPTSSPSISGTSSPPRSPPASTDTSPCPHIARATNTNRTWKPGICCCKPHPPICHPDRSEAQRAQWRDLAFSRHTEM